MFIARQGGRRWRSPWLLAAALIAGCASIPPDARLQDRSRPVPELIATPFFPQERYQCGPAALATLLTAGGIQTSPDALVDQVYVPARRGSLQVEMIAAARAAGRLPYILDPSLTAVAAELAAGRPVLVLQNLGVGWLSRWHYAVVVGIDTANDAVILRSGTDRRRVTDMDVFLRTWQRSDFWAFVVLPPGQLPANPRHDRYVAAVADLEAVGRLDDARDAWLPALRQWPASALPAFGLGNIELARGEPQDAERWYREALARDPGYLMAANNLAYALVARGQFAAAETELETALERAGDPATVAILRESLADIREQRRRR